MGTPETEDNEKEETTMINQVITNIQNDLLGILDENQMKLLSEVLTKHLLPLQSATTESKNEKSDMLPVFIAAKRVEGCSNLQSGTCWNASASRNVR